MKQTAIVVFPDGSRVEFVVEAPDAATMERALATLKANARPIFEQAINGGIPAEGLDLYIEPPVTPEERW